MKEKVLQEFARVFGNGDDAKVYFAPGRVNMIGEHTDYNGGHVFPCALTMGTYAVARKRNDNKLRLYSINFEKLGVLESTRDEFSIISTIWSRVKSGLASSHRAMTPAANGHAIDVPVLVPQ